MLSWRIPAKLRSTEAKARVEGVSVAVAIVLLLAIPAQLSAPILTGSITWRPALGYVPSSAPVQGISTGLSQADAGSFAWDEFVILTQYRDSIATSAVRNADITWGLSPEADPSRMERVLGKADLPPINSTLGNVLVPFFRLESLQWLADPNGTLALDQVDTMLMRSNFTSQVNPMHNSAFAGGSPNLAYLSPTPWQAPQRNASSPNNHFVVPDASTAPRSTEMYLAVMVGRGANPGECTRDESINVFGDIAPNVGIVQDPFAPFKIPGATMGGIYYAPSDNFDCYSFAKVRITAGSAVCQDCRVVSSRSVRGDVNQLVWQPDRLATTAMAMVPDVVTTMLARNFSLPAQWGRMDSFVEEITLRAYSSAWTALYDSVGRLSPTATAAASVPLQVSQASVKTWRVVLWLALQALVWVGSLIFAYIHSLSSRSLVADPSVAALLIDSSRLRDVVSPNDGDARVLTRVTKSLSQAFGTLSLRGCELVRGNGKIDDD